MSKFRGTGRPSRAGAPAAVPAQINSSASVFSPPPPLSDEILVARVCAGQVHVYEEIIRRYERPIVNFIYRMIGDYEQSLDLAQEVFFKAYRSLDRFDPTFRFSTWLYRIASNRSIDHLRKQSPTFLSLDEPGDPERGEDRVVQLKCPTRGPEDLLSSRELGDRIGEAIDTLPVPYRQLILLRHLQGMAYDDIARVMGLPLGTVKNRLFRAREILRKRLDH
jgi:RNA polymerase sigma-70 factor (ECF subfamily)